MITGIEIRKAVNADEPAVAALWSECFSEGDHIAGFRFAIQSPATVVLLAEAVDGTIVGSLLAGYDGFRGWLHLIATKTSERRKGIGKSLIRAGEEWLKGHGANRIRLLVDEDNIQVVDFYKSAGYGILPTVLLGKSV